MPDVVVGRLFAPRLREYTSLMKPSLSIRMLGLGFAVMTGAHAQLMHVTFDTTHIEGDFYEINIASPDRNEFGDPIHHPHPITGRFQFETDVDLAAANAPGAPQLFNYRLWGDIDVLGHVDTGPFGLMVTHLSNGDWSLETPSENVIGAFMLSAQVSLKPDLSPRGAYIELRVFDPETALGFFQGNPGYYLVDTRVMIYASADDMTATRVQDPSMTPVPEPATITWISALGLCGLIGWRRWSRGQVEMRASEM